MKQLLVLLGVIALGVGVACKDNLGNGNGCASTLADVVIKAQDNLTYDKPSVTISRQQRVCWENGGSMAHSVTGLVTQVKGDTVDTLWNINAQLNPESVVLSSFNVVGDYPYNCRYHQGSGMTGVIQVR